MGAAWSREAGAQDSDDSGLHQVTRKNPRGLSHLLRAPGLPEPSAVLAPGLASWSLARATTALHAGKSRQTMPWCRETRLLRLPRCVLVLGLSFLGQGGGACVGWTPCLMEQAKNTFQASGSLKFKQTTTNPEEGRDVLLAVLKQSGKFHACDPVCCRAPQRRK